MKTKNILKIGAFSIVILSLLISPILKSITPEANAFNNFAWGLFGNGTSATGLNLEDYLSACTSSAVNNTITNNPTAYTVLCCNEDDLSFSKVQSSASYPTLEANCKAAQETASSQGIPPFDEEQEKWCFAPQVNGDYAYPLDNIENSLNYIENCCKSGDQSTNSVTQNQIDALCQKAEDTLATYLLTEVVIEQETDIKDCVVKEYDENDPAIKLLYNDNQLYIEKCCNFAPDKVNSLSTSDQALLAQRCSWAAQGEDIDLFTGKPPTITPVAEPPHYYGPNITQEQYEDIQEYIKEKEAEEICGNVGSWSVGWAANIDFKPLYQKISCVIQKGIIEGLGKMFAGIMNLEINMILWAFKPSTYGGFVNNPAVQGTTDNPGVWNFMRNLVNLVLVLALVVIAIASILGIKKYSWQNTLWKLVIVALLVNFSLVIAGMILDSSNFLSYYFLNLAKGENKNISESISSSFDVEGISSADKYELPSVSDQTQKTTTGWGMGWGQFLLVAFAIILIGLFAVIALLAIFLAMIVRSFIIIVLLCLSPVAFAAWILPDTEKYWKMWWEQFIKWCTFPIIFGLMLYIGVFAVNNLGIKTEKGIGMMAFIIQIMLFSMFLVGGLIFSVQGGGAAAQFVMKQGSKVGSAVGGFALGKLLTAGARTDEQGNIIPSYYDRAAQAMTHIPLIGSGLAMNLYKIKGQVTSRTAEKINKDVDLIKNNADALDAYFAQSINALGKMKAIVAKAQAGLTLTGRQMDWYRSYGSSTFAGTEDNRIIQKAIPALRNGGNIEVNELTRRITPVLQNREASEKLLSTNIFDYMHINRPGEFGYFVHQLLQNIGSPRQLENLLLSINFENRDRILGYINDAVDNDMSGFLQQRNPNLYAMLTNPNPSPQESGAISNLRQYFNIV